MLPLLVIAAGSIARQAGFGWARNRLAMGAFCVVAVGLSAHDIPKIFDMDLRVACLADTVRYTTSVSPAQVCPGGEAYTQGAEAALVAIVTNVIVLAVGIALWIGRRWPWLAVGAATMFVAAGAFARSPWSLPIANFGEICITASLIATCVHFARLAGARRPAPAQAMRQAA
jgi:uncharacterized membrane protein YphA (DoxX/SURF4 family)